VSENIDATAQFQNALRSALLALKKDVIPIVVFTLLMTVLGFVAGKKILADNKSTAHLVQAPVPSRGAAESIELAPKLDITSVTLLCKSDEVLERTLRAIEDTGQMTRPLPSIRGLASSLSYELTIAKETPMDTVFSEILELTAKSKAPEDAALMVNTWADEIVAAVDRYEAGLEEPLLEIFNREFGEAETTLAGVEEEKDRWYTEHDLELLHARSATVRQMTMLHLERLTELDTELSQEQAKAAAYKGSVESLEPELSLSWFVPDPAIVGQLQSRLGSLLGDQAAAPTPPKADAEGTGPASPSEAPEEGAKVLTQETINEVYWESYGELLMTEANVAGLDAARERTLALLEEHEAELQELNEEITRLETEKTRLERQYSLAEKVHDTFHERRKWIEIASQVDYHTLQILSRGTAWPTTQLWGFVTAAALGACALACAVCASLFVRLLLVPALRESA